VEILRVNMTDLTARREATPPAWRSWGGRGLIDRILSEEVPPTCDPLGGANRLVIAPGLLAGRGVSTGDRLSIGAKSPLTGTIKESNTGGNAGGNLASLGLRAVIIEGSPQGEQRYILHITREKAEFLPAEPYWGQSIFEGCARMRETFGQKAAILCIGVTGERGLPNSIIASTDPDGLPTRSASRGGMGAVMGAKGLKAIVVQDPGSRRGAPLTDPGAFRQARQRYHQALADEYFTSKVFPDFGTSFVMENVNLHGAFPCRNYTYGTLQHVNQISGQALREIIQKRGGQGKTTHICMPGCTVRSSNVVPDEQGQYLTSTLQYEAIGEFGANLGIADLDAIARLNQMCNDIGLDVIETGATLGVALEAGLLTWGDARGAARLLGEVRGGTILGRLLASGAATFGRVMGVRRLPVVKGQALAAYDPRAYKGLGVTYATSPQGADHTAGYPIYSRQDPHLAEGQVAVSREVQVLRAANDSLGLCSFVLAVTGPQPELVNDLLEAAHGPGVCLPFPEEMGREVLRMELAFNRAAGFTTAHDRLPEFFRAEKLPPFDLTFDVPQEELERVFEWG
jgi:aldehyde:ferredoxin oxidoreductase